MTCSRSKTQQVTLGWDQNKRLLCSTTHGFHGSPPSACHEAEASSYLHVLAWPGLAQQKARALGAGMATPAVPLAISDKPLTQWDLNTAARCADCSSSLT